jgi:hypothetical protein
MSDSIPSPSSAPGAPDQRQQILQLIDRAACDLGRTPEGVATAEEAVRLADAIEDPQLGFQAREVLMENATFGGYPEKLLVAFAWCLARADSDPNWDPDSWQGITLLWRYKWVIENAVDFPGIPRDRILAMIEDFRTRCLSASYTERPALDLRFSVERSMGNFDAAREWFERWRVTERDSLSDCPACELNGIVTFLARSGRHEEAIREAAPLLTGESGCAEVPHHTYATLLESYWATGRPEEAARSHAVGYPMVKSNRAFLQSHADHLQHLVRAGQLDAGLPLLRKHLPWALESRCGKDRFSFLLASRALLRALDAQGIRSIRLRVNPALCPAAGKTTARVDALLAWMEPMLAELARQFDTRNGNSWFSRRLEGPDSLPKAA